ncbi:MAG: hypothetical protein JSW39_03010 [Desulfobacterales bacterium]|nr:MAG: hypothetical protein JSW39_03010 [Desulfobacterales bacterium]
MVEHKVSKGFTCLAKGADQLFAAVLTAKGLPFTAIIPCRGYEKAFADVVNFAHQAGKTVVHVDPVTQKTTIL